jgi:hypothetical protein
MFIIYQTAIRVQLRKISLLHLRYELNLSLYIISKLN